MNLGLYFAKEMVLITQTWHS